MKIFQDVFTNEELMSDVYPFELAHEDVIIKVKSKLKYKDQVGNVDIGCGNAFGGEEEESHTNAGGEPEEKVLDVVYNFNLVQTHFSKNEFMTYIKNYLKTLKTYLEENGQSDRAATFQKGAQEFIKFIVTKFDDVEFYTGTKETLDGGIVYAFWEDDTASGPVFYFFKDGLKEVKC